jgi:hypothetical protein
MQPIVFNNCLIVQRDIDMTISISNVKISWNVNKWNEMKWRNNMNTAYGQTHTIIIDNSVFHEILSYILVHCYTEKAEKHWIR